MKKLILIFIVFLLLACSNHDQRRTLNDAYQYADEYTGFDVLHFVVEANCDYQYFFDYPPMRNGGYYAYGYHSDQPHLLIIPKYANDEIKAVPWPMYHTIAEAVELLNQAHGEVVLDEAAMYNDIYIELTSSVLRDHSNADYDLAFFIIIPIEGVNYVAFQRDLELVIYHEFDGFYTSSSLHN